MKFYWRMLLVALRALLKPRRGVQDVGRIRMRVLPTDCDVFFHMNNGVYLTVQDLGRLDWMVRTGLWRPLQRRRWNPVAARVTMSYRRSLDLGVEYELETRLLGSDERNIYIEHRFVSGGQLCAQGFFVGRFLGPDGPVPMARVRAEVLGDDVLVERVPDWLRQWADAARLPSAGRDFPSVWRNETPSGAGISADR